jgi:hypothetical protein
VNLFPFYEVAATAKKRSEEGWDTYQQFTCGGCGVKQTMPDKNVFHKKGRCEECDAITDIEKAGCNFMAAKSLTGRPWPVEVPRTKP